MVFGTARFSLTPTTLLPVSVLGGGGAPRARLVPTRLDDLAEGLAAHHADGGGQALHVFEQGHARRVRRHSALSQADSEPERSAQGPSARGRPGANSSEVSVGNYKCLAASNHPPGGERRHARGTGSARTSLPSPCRRFRRTESRCSASPPLSLSAPPPLGTSASRHLGISAPPPLGISASPPLGTSASRHLRLSAPRTGRLRERGSPGTLGLRNSVSRSSLSPPTMIVPRSIFVDGILAAKVSFSGRAPRVTIC